MADYSGGLLSLEIQAEDFSYLAVPYQNEAMYEGSLLSWGADSLTVESADWTANELSADAEGRPRYYVRFLSGELQGLYFAILGNGEDRLWLHTLSWQLDALPIGSFAPGDQLQIVPFMTIGQVFGIEYPLIETTPGEAEFYSDYVVLTDPMALNGGQQRVVYVDETGVWRVDGAATLDGASEILWPGMQVVVRNSGAAKQISSLGPVVVNDWIIPYGPGDLAGSRRVIRLAHLGYESRPLAELGLISDQEGFNVLEASVNRFRPQAIMRLEQTGSTSENETDFLLNFRNHGWAVFRGMDPNLFEREIFPGAALSIYTPRNATEGGFWKWEFSQDNTENTND